MSEEILAPVLNVSKDNIEKCFPHILLAVKDATYIAVDLELSGLGDRKGLQNKDINARYQAILKTAQSYSILSIGLSCFKELPSESNKQKLLVQTFNVLVQRSEAYVVDPSSLRFLVQHGFDFHRLYLSGIQYKSGTESNVKRDQNVDYIRQLFTQVIAAHKPLVLHNAWLDLVFLYQAVHCDLPSSLDVFLADLTEMFPAGIFDTKYLAEFVTRFPASFLEYVFRKCQRVNNKETRTNQRRVTLQLPRYPDDWKHVTYKRLTSLPSTKNSSDWKRLCVSFAAHGFCSADVNCTLSHDIDLALDHEDMVLLTAKQRRRKRRQRQPKQEVAGNGLTESGNEISEHSGSSDAEEPDSKRSKPCDTEVDESRVKSDVISSDISASTAQVDSCSVNNSCTTEDSRTDVTEARDGRSSGTHRAGFDAFMTGYIAAVTAQRWGKDSKIGLQGIDFAKNLLALRSKDFPLTVRKGNFTKTSVSHRQRFERLFGAQTHK